MFPLHLMKLNVSCQMRRPEKSLTAAVPADVHTEAVQAALAKYRERKVPLPSKRRSVLVPSSAEACTPPGRTTRVSVGLLGFRLPLVHLLPCDLEYPLTCGED